MSESTMHLVRAQLAVILAQEGVENLAGVCNLAAGADQIFARETLAAGGRLRVIIPSVDYATTFITTADHDAYDALLRLADECIELSYERASEEAFMAGGRAVVDRCERLLAVWDGKPAAGLGGTADVVTYAREQGKPVEIVWPRGAARR